MKELAEQIIELNKYLDKNPWDMIKRTERYELIDELCNRVLNS
jgi:methionyl-tRNA synthetase